MFHRQILWIVATFLLRISEQKSFSSCRNYICYLEATIIIPKEPYIFYPHNIDPDLCSHIILSFVGLDGNKLHIANWNADKRLTNINEHLKTLKLRKPKLKLLLAVGGSSPNSLRFSKMAATGTGRREFINSLIPFVREHGFDGVDLDWVFPTAFGGVKSDKETYAALIKEMATAFETESSSSGHRKLLLSVWGANGEKRIDMGYNVTEFARYVDMINILTFMYNNNVNTPIGHVAPLDSDDGENIKESVKNWVKRGMPKIKINIALAGFGYRVYTNSSNDVKIGESIVKGNAPTSNSRWSAYLTYYQVCSLLKQGGRVHWDSLASAPYHIIDNYFLSYENEEGIKNKVRFIRENHYGGVVLRSLLEDDFLGRECGNGPYPLLRTMKEQCTIKIY